MPIPKNLPVRLKGGRVPGELDDAPPIYRKMSLGPSPDDDWRRGNERSLLDGGAPGNRNPFEDEEDENEANEVRKGGAGRSSLRGLMKGVSPLLGKLGKRMSGRHKGGDTTPSSPQGSLQGTPSPAERKKKGRRSSEGSLLRFAGKCRDSLRRDSLSNGGGEPHPDSEADTPSRRVSFMKLVGLGGGKHKRESQADHASSLDPEEEEAEEEEEEAVEEVKPREPLSVLEILQLVTKRDLLLADTHILELEQECTEAAASSGAVSAATPDDPLSPGSKDGGRRKAKDVELLYEALQKELWAVVRESLRSPTAGPNLGLVVQVLQQEEQTDRDSVSLGGRRPRQLKQRWKEALGEAADNALPQRREAQGGELADYLDRLRVRVVEDLGAAKRNVVSIYPEDYQAFQVYVKSYHQAVTRRLQAVADDQLQITDIYSLLDWLYNIYNRDVLGTVCITSPFRRSSLGPLLPSETVERLELDCLNSVRAKVTTELSQVLDEEEKRWMETLHIEEYNISLAKTVIKRLQEDLERSAEINRGLGCRVSQCSLNGLADFLYSFQRKTEMFHEGVMSGMFGTNEDGYLSRTVAMVNCCPPFRSFVQRCVQCDPSINEDSVRRAETSLDRIVTQGVKVLTDRLYESMRPSFDKLVKRKWLTNSEPFQQIQDLIKEHFKRFRRLDDPPYQVLVTEVHRRVLIEYLRSIMRGRIICTSQKMRKRMASRMRDEGTQIKALFKDLESPSSWLDSALPHLSEAIVLEDIPSIQMEVGVLVREFPDVRRKHVSALLNIRGLTSQRERQEILNIVRDIESSEAGGSGGSATMTRERAVFAEVPVTSEVHCLNVGLSRIALTAAACFSGLRPPRKRSPARHASDDQL